MELERYKDVFRIAAIFLTFLILGIFFKVTVVISFVTGFIVTLLGLFLSYWHFLLLQKFNINSFFLIGLIFGEFLKVAVILSGLFVAGSFFLEFNWLSAIVGMGFGLFFFTLLLGIPNVINIAKISQFMHNST